MLDIEYNKIPYTGGRFYDYIDKETFEFYWQFKDHYTLDELRTGQEYTFYRMARDARDEIVYMRIKGYLVDRNDHQMFFMHRPMKGKTMYLDGYKEHWFFLIGDTIPNEVA